MDLEEASAQDGPRPTRGPARKPSGSSGLLLRDNIVHSYCRGMSSYWESTQKILMTHEPTVSLGGIAYRATTLAPVAGQMVESADILDTHDQYRVKLVEVDFIYNGAAYANRLPTFPTPGPRTEAWSYVPVLYVAYDGDTVSYPSWDSMRQRGSTKSILLRPGKKVTISYKPKVLQSLEGETGYAMVTCPRLDASNGNVPLRGLVYGVTYPNPSGTYGDTTSGTLFVQARLYLDCYGQR